MSEEINDQEKVTEDTGSVETTETGEDTSTKQEKPSETPEARMARLMRQTNRQRKAMGLPPLVEALVEKQTAPKAEKKGFDYGEKAYLKASGIDPQDFEFVKEVMESTNKDLDSVLSSKYFQAELKERKDLRMTDQATPSGSKRAGNTTKDQVDYWLAKGELPPDRELRIKVVNAKIKAAEGQSKFTDQPVAGTLFR